MRPPLDVRLRNSSKRAGEDLWEWKVWVEGADDALDKIVAVRYLLHHTFREPICTVQDRTTKFALESAGWGEFLIRAEIMPQWKTPFTLERWLTFDEAASDAMPERQPTLFISSGATDGALVRSLKKELTAQGVTVVIPEADLEIGTPWRLQTAEMIKSSDAVAVVVSEEVCDIAELDVETAIQANKPVIPIVIGDVTLPKPLEDFQKIEMKRFGKIEAVADTICARVKDAFYPDKFVE